MSRQVFLTFADQRMKAGRKRIYRQARDMEIYTDFIAASDKDLAPGFRKRFRDYLRPEHRGYGYYCWKPQIVFQVLEGLSKGDVVHWIDAGCHLNPRGRARLLDYLAMANEAPSGFHGFLCLPPNGSLFYQGRQFPNQAEYMWTKGDLLNRLRVRDNPEITATQQIGATTFLVRKCDIAMDFLSEWIRIFSDDFSMIDDRPSIAPNMEGFIEHRHDQSIYSILGKLLPISMTSVFEFWFPRDDDCWSPDWEKVKDSPIQIRRDRGVKPQSSMLLAFLRAKGRLKDVMARI
jgi:hypothetical protein